MRRLDAYITKEIFRPFAAALLVCVSLFWVMALFRSTEIIFGAAARFTDFVQVLLFLAPQFLIQSLPVAFLLGLLLGVSRLKEDSELKVIAALGISSARLILPIFLSSIVVSVFWFAFASLAQPHGARAVRELASEVIRRNLAAEIKPGIVYDALPNTVVLTKEVTPDGLWHGVLLFDSSLSNAPMWVTGRTARMDAPEKGRSLRLHVTDGHIHQDDAKKGYTLVDFDSGTFSLDAASSLSQRNKVAGAVEEMTMNDLREHVQKTALDSDEHRFYLTQWHNRWAPALAPMVLVFPALYFMFRHSKTGRGQAFIWALGLYVVYQLLSRSGVSLSEKGRLPTFVGPHLANLTFVIVAAFFLVKQKLKT